MSKEKVSKFQIWVTVLGFLELLFVPSVAWVFCHGAVGDDTSENRKLAEMPEFKLGKISTFPSNFEKFWNDHVPFRSIIRRTWSDLNVIGLHDSTSDKVLIGKNEDGFKNSWLFYSAKSDNNPVEDIQGIKTYNEQTLEKMVDKIKGETEKYRQKGIQLYYLVAPNKEDVYKEKLPDEIEIYRKKTRTEELTEYLVEKKIENYYFAYEDMLDAKDLGQLYYKQDTHWNKLGAFVGFKGLMDMIGEKVTLEKVEFTEEKKIGGDLLPMLGVSGYFEDKNVSVVSKNEKINKKIMVIGDSYRTALKDYLEKTFSKVVMMHRSEYKKGMVEEIKPEILVYEFVERYAGAIKDFTTS